MKKDTPAFCPNCKFDLANESEHKPRRQTTLNSSLFRKGSLGQPSQPMLDLSEDDNTFTVIKTNYKLDRKKKVHEDVNRNSYFNITAMEMDSKRNIKKKICWSLQDRTRLLR
jgi:hypothetical protein